MKATKHRVVPAWRRKLLTLAVASCFAGEFAYANPTGPAVAQGQASIATQGNVLTVTNTPGTVINWQGFSIASQDITRFLQQSAASAVLNRVVGVNPSTILGTLQSNGRVFLINPSGITIGPGATIDVAGFIASTLNLSDPDFLAGRYRFTPSTGTGSVVNQGTIKTPAGGMVYLVGQNVENHGIITSPKGEILLAAGKSIELVDAGTPEIRVQITASSEQALNLGQLIASGGRIGMYGGLVRQSGVVNANTAVVGENGKIAFKAVKDVKLDAGSTTTASGPTGGSVKFEAETGKATIAGTVEANASAGRGGSIEVSGRQAVTVEGAGRLSANGTTDGGVVTLSSSAGPVQVSGQVSANASAGRGGQVAIAAATQASVTTGATVTASGNLGGGSVSAKAGESVSFETGSAIQANGASGGVVTISAEQGAVAINGSIEATGTDAQGGAIRVAALTDITLGDGSVLSTLGQRGGEVRIEARRGTLLASGSIDGSGNDGTGGRILLLAPRVGLIRNASLNVSGKTGGGEALVGGDFQGSNPDISNAERTYVGPNVLITGDAIETGNGGKVIIWADGDTRFYGQISARGGTQSGDGGFVEVSGKQHLTYSGLVDTRAPNGKTGTLLLDPTDITIQATGPTTIELDATGDPDVFQETTPTNTSILTTTDLQNQLNLSNVLVTTQSGASGTGDITVADDITYGGGSDRILTLKAENSIVFSANANLTSTTKKLDVVLHADSDNSGAGAIVMNVGSSIVSNGGNITLGGGLDPATNPAMGTATNSNGVSILGATLDASGGHISIRGSTAVSGGSKYGVLIDTGSIIQTTGTGNITVVGNAVAGTTGGDNDGIHMLGGTISTNATATGGAILMIGTGGTGTLDASDGLQIEIPALIQSLGSAASGTVTITGTRGSGNQNHRSVYLDGDVTSVAGNISITGNAGGTVVGSTNYGVMINGSGLVQSTGAATITVTGTAGAGASFNRGVVNAGTVSSSTGNIAIIGTGSGTGTDNDGVQLVATGIVESTGTANVNITGTAGTGGVGILTITGTNRIGSATMTGDITLRADTIDIANNISIITSTTGGTRNVYLLPDTFGTATSIGGSSGFDLTQTELTKISTNVNRIVVGEDATPTVTAGVTTIGASNAVSIGARNLTVSGSSIALDNAGGTNTLTTTGNVTLKTTSGNVTTNATTGTDISAGSLTLNIGSNSAGTVGSPLRTTVGTLSATAGNVFVKESDDISLGLSTVSGTYSVTAGGAITQSAAISANTLTAKTLDNSGSDITLTNAGNEVTTINLSSRNAGDTTNDSGVISYRDATGFDVAGIGTTSTVTLQAGGAITDSGAIAGTILTTTSSGGATLDFGHSVTTLNATNTTSGNIDFSNAVALTITGASQSGGGSVNVTTATGNISINDNAISAGAGAVTLQATTGSILDGDNGATASITTTGPVTLKALGTTGSIGASGAGQIDIANSPNLTLQAKKDVFVITTGTNLTNLDLTVDPNNAATYSITAPGLTNFVVTNNGTDLTVTKVASTSLTNFSLTADTGNIKLDEVGQGGGISLGSANVTLTASNGNIIDLSAGTEGANIAVTSGTVTLKANKIGTVTAGEDVDITGATNLVLQAKNGTFASNDTTLASFSLSLDPAIDANYSLTSGNTVISIVDTGADLRIDQVSNNGTKFDFTLTAPTGNILLKDGAIGGTGLNSIGNGNVSLTSTAGSITDGTATSITTSGTLTLTAAGDIGAAGNPLNTAVPNVSLSTTSGLINLLNTGALTVMGFSNPGAGTTTIKTASPLTIASNMIQAGTIDLEAPEAVIAASGDDLTVNTGVIVRSTAGNVLLKAGDNVVLSGTSLVESTVGGGTVTITAGFGDNDAAGAILGSGSVSGVNVTLSAITGIGTLVTPLTTAASALSATTTAAGGGIFINETDALTSLTVKLNNSANTTDATINWDNNGVAAGTNALTFVGSTSVLNASAATAPATNVSFENSGGGISVGLVDAGTANVTLKSAGSITDGNGATNNVTATSLTASAGTGIDLDTTIGTLTAANVTGTGAIDIANTGALVVTSATTNDGAITLSAAGGKLTLSTVTAGGGKNVTASTTTSGDIDVGSVSGAVVSLTAAAAITDGNGATNNVTATSLTASAGTGIDLDTTIGTLTAANVTGTGAIDIANTGALVVTSATTNDGAITLSAAGGKLTLSTVTAGGGKNVTASTTTSGDIDVGSVSGAVVSLTAAAAITDGNGATNNVTATSLTASAGTGIDLDTTIGTLTAANVTGTGAIDIANTGALVVTSATTNDGAITLSAAGGKLTLSTVTAGGGKNVTASTTTSGDIDVGSVSGAVVSLTAAAAITDGNGATNNVTATSLTASAGTGIDLDTTIGTLTAANVTGTGAIDIANTGALVVTSATTNDGAITLSAAGGKLTLSTVTAGGGKNVTASTTTSGDIDVGSVSGAVVSLTAAAAITDGNGATNNVTATSLTASAGTGIDLDTTIGTLTAANVTGTGAIDIANTGALVVTSATTNDGAITLSAAGGKLTLSTVTAGGGKNVTASTTTSGDIDVGSVSGAVVSLTAAAAITDGNGATNNVTATSLTASAGTGIDLDTTIGTLTAANVTGTGAIDIANTGALVVTSATTNDGAITLSAAGGKLTLSTVTAGGGKNVTASTTTSGDIDVGSVSGAVVSLTAAAAITDGNGATNNVTATSLTASAGTGIDLDTTIGTLTAANVTGTGAIDIANTGALVVTSATTNDGAITLSAAGGKLTLSTVTAGGGKNVTASTTTSGDIDVGSVSGAVVSLTAAAAITDGNGATNNVTATSLTASAGTGIDLDTTIGTLTAANVTGTGAIDIANTGALVVTSATTNDGAITLSAAGGKLTLSTVTAGGGKNVTASTTTSGDIDVGSVSGAVVSLTAAAAITDGNGATNNVTATSLTASAGTGIDLDTTIGTLTAANVTGTGAIDIANTGALVVTSATTNDGAITLSAAGGKLTLSTVTAGGGKNVTASTTTSGDIDVGSVSGAVVSLTAAAAITDGNGATNNVTATSLTASAGTGIDLDTTIGTLTAANVTGTGAIDIANTGALVVTSATTNDGAITLSAAGGKLTLSTVTAGGGKNVTASTTTSGDIDVGSVSGAVVSLTAAAAITDGNGATNNVTATSLTASAGTGIDLDTTIGTLTAANVTGTGAIDIANTGALVVTSATTNDGAITLSAAGGKLTLSTVTAGGGKNVTASTTTSGDIDVGSVSGAVVSLTAAAAITDGNGATNNVTATSLTASAGTGIDLDTTIGTLTAANVTGTGAIDIANTGALVVTSATTNDGAITLSAAGGKLTLSTVTAGGGKNVTASTTTSGDIDVGSVSGAVVSLTAAAAITDGNGATNNVTATSLTASAGTGIDLDTTIGTLTAANVTGTGAIDIANTGALVVTSATTNDGAITLSAAGGKLTLSTVTAGGTARDVTATTTTTGDIAVGNVSAAGDRIKLTSAAAIDGGGTATANELVLDAATNIGASVRLQSDVTILEARAANGGIFLTEASALQIGGATTGTLTGVSTTGGNGMIDIRTTAGGITIIENVAANGSGGVDLRSGGVTSDIGINGVTISSGTGTLQLIAGQAITTSTPTNTTTELSTGGAVRLQSGTVIGTTGNRIETQVATLAAEAGGNIFIREVDAVAIGSVNALNSATPDPLVGITSTGGAVILTAGTTLDVNQAVSAATGVTLSSVGAMTILAAGDISGGNGVVSLTGSTISTAGDVSTTGQDITFNNSPTTLIGNVLVSSGAGNITFGNTVDGAFDLTANASGITTFSNTVGSTTPLVNLTTDNVGSTVINGGLVKTTGNQTYGDGLTLGVNTQLVTTSNGNISAATITGAGGGGQNLTLAAGGGDITVSGDIGAARLGTLTVTSGNVVQFQGTGTQQVASLTVTSSTSTAFAGKLDLTSGVSLAAGAGNVSFLNGLATSAASTFSNTGTLQIGDQTADTTSITGGITHTAGPTALAGGITVTGPISVNAMTLPAGQTATLNAGANAVTFNTTVDGPGGLVVNSSGLTTFAGAAGGVTPLGGVQTNAGGTTQVNGGTIATDGAVGGMLFGDPVTINQTSVFSTTGNGSTGANININQTLTGPGGATDLTLNAGTTGNVTTTGTVSGIQNLTVDGANVNMGGGVVHTVNNIVTFNSTGDVTYAQNGALLIGLSNVIGTATITANNGPIFTGGVGNGFTAGSMILTATDTLGTDVGTLRVGAGGISTNGGLITLKSADGMTINGPVISNGGNIILVAGNAPGMASLGIPLATNNGGVALGTMAINAPVRGGTGNVTIYSTGPVSQALPATDAGVQTSNVLTVRTYNDNAGAATITMENDKITPAVTCATGNPGSGNCATQITLETRQAGDTGVASTTPFPGGFAASEIRYKSISGTQIIGIGTASDVLLEADSWTLNAGAINGGNVNIVATGASGGGNINVGIAIPSSFINNNTTGGSLNLRAARDINILPGGSIGTSATRFDHNLVLAAGDDISIQGSIYLNGNLNLRANALAADLGGNVPFTNTGSVIIATPGATSVEVRAKDITVGDVARPVQAITMTAGNAGTGQSADAILRADGVLSINTSGNLAATGGTATASAPSATDTTADAIFRGNVVDLLIGGNFNLTGGSPTITGSAGTLQEARALAKLEGDIIALRVNGNATLLGGYAIAAAGGNTSKASATISSGSTFDPIIVGDLTVKGGTSSAQPVAGQTAMAEAMAEIHTPGDLHLNVGRDLIITGGMATASTQAGGIAATATSAASLNADGIKNIQVGRDFTVTGGAAATAGAGATATALAGTDAGTALIGSVSLRITTGGNMMLLGGTEFGADTLASAAILSAGEIKMFINGPLGLSLGGGGGSDMFQLVGNTLISVEGKSYPITIQGGFGTNGGLALGDAFIISGAPPLNLDALLAAFLRTTDCVTFSGGSCTVPGTSTTRSADTAKSAGGAGVCK